MKKLLAIFLSVSMLLAGCSGTPSEAPEAKPSEAAPSETVSSEAPEAKPSEAAPSESATRIITDAQGRQVEIPSDAKTLVAMGPSTLRMVCYMGLQDNIVGIEDAEEEPDINKPYNMVNPQLHDLPVVSGASKGGLTPYEEELLKVKPDVILMSFSKVDLGENLQTKLGIPVVFVNTRGGIFEDSWYDSLKLIAEIFGHEERIGEIKTYVDSVISDLGSRTKDVTEKPTAYYGAAWFRGEHNIDGTVLNYPPFMVTNITSPADELAEKGQVGKSTVVDLEKILEWNPEIVFLDEQNVHLVEDMYKENPTFFENINAFKNDRIYTQICYTYYGANLEMAIINAYYAGSVVYPEQFKDINIDEIAEEAFNKLLGGSCWEEMKESGKLLHQIHIGK